MSSSRSVEIGTSVIVSKAANEYRFKTGQRICLGQWMFYSAGD
jgi:hypothetical protein